MTLFLLLIFLSSWVFGERLEPRRRTIHTESISTIEANGINEKEGASSFDRDHPLQSWTIGVVLGTPLFLQNTYDNGWSTLALGPTLSIPLFMPGPASVHLETGALVTISRLTLTQPTVSFTHYYFYFPLKARLLLGLSRAFSLEAQAGALIRPLEYDSRNTTDGGFHSGQNVTAFEPDAGVGFIWSVSLAVRTRFIVSYQFLLGGIELVL